MSLQELAALVSSTLEKAGIKAVLSGGAAVSIYSDNAYESADLDFVSSDSKKELSLALSELKFTQAGGTRMFEHPECQWYIEFPPGPLGFGDLHVEVDEIPLLNTEFGQLRIITPTLSVADRLAAFWYHSDRQCWDQAIEVAKRHPIDWDFIYNWATKEEQDHEDIKSLQRQVGN